MIKPYLSRKVIRKTNVKKDEVEFEIFRYPHYYKVVATICQDFPPYKDFIGVGKSSFSEERAIKKAIKDLYQYAYPDINPRA